MASFPDADKETLIKHGLKALAGCVQSDKVLEASNASIVVIGPEQTYGSIEDADVQPYLDAIEAEGVSLAAAAAAGAEEGEEAKDADGDASMS